MMTGPEIPTRTVPPKLSQGDRIFGEFVTFGIFAALFFGVVLGIPYLYRLATSAWAAPSGHSQTSLTGTWTGALRAPEVKTDYQKDPFESEAGYRLGMESALREKRSHLQKARAIYVDLGLDPWHFGSPRLRGKVYMCAFNGAKADFEFTTKSVNDSGASLILTTKASDEFGNLTLHWDGGKLKSGYEVLGNSIRGDLTRGNLQDFQNMCDQVRQTAQADLPQ